MKLAIGAYDHTRALKDGTVVSPDLPLEFVEVSPITRAFRGMASEQAYDASEMALATYMLARAYNKPIVGLPIVLVRSPLLAGLVTAADSPITDPRLLNGKTLGVRSYTQTSAVWVRGMLQDAFGVDLSSLRWVTLEAAHLAEYREPPNVSRASSGAELADMVRRADVAAAVGLPLSDGLRTLIPDAAKAEADWAASSGVRTVNHIVAVKSSLVEEDPELPRKLTDLFERARGGNVSIPPIGVEPNRKAFEALARYCYEQKVTPRQMTIEELFPRDLTSGARS